MTSAPEPYRIDVHAHHIAPAYRCATSQSESGEQGESGEQPEAAGDEPL